MRWPLRLVKPTYSYLRLELWILDAVTPGIPQEDEQVFLRLPRSLALPRETFHVVRSGREVGLEARRGVMRLSVDATITAVPTVALSGSLPIGAVRERLQILRRRRKVLEMGPAIYRSARATNKAGR